MKQFLQHYWPFFVVALVGVVLSFMVVSYAVIERESRYVYGLADPALQEVAQPIRVGIVFGGGVRDDGPSPIVQDRLETAKQLLERGYVDKLLLSGDNRSLDYNEPQVMYDYLIEHGVVPQSLQRDFAGRSTYETCERARNVFGIEQALLISQATHLDRAIYLCRHFGITSYGVNSPGSASAGLQVGQRWREVLARSKAIFNAHLYGENTVLGDPIEL